MRGGGGVTGITAQSSYMKKVTFIGGHRGQRELRQESLIHLTSKEEDLPRNLLAHHGSSPATTM